MRVLSVRWRSLDIRLTLCAIPVFAILMGLGWWQVERLQWKEALIAGRAAGYEAPPLAIRDIRVDAWKEHEHRRVVVHGRFLHDHEMLLFNRQQNGQSGFGLITPMQLQNGRTVLVDRGWVPRDWEQRNATAYRPAGLIEATGVLRAGGRPNRWVPPNEPSSGQWFHTDAEQMAAAAGLTDPLPYIVRLVPSDTRAPFYPRPAPGVAALSNRHLEYAVTWFGLAAVLIVICVLYHVRKPE